MKFKWIFGDKANRAFKKQCFKFGYTRYHGTDYAFTRELRQCSKSNWPNLKEGSVITCKVTDNNNNEYCAYFTVIDPAAPDDSNDFVDWENADHIVLQPGSVTEQGLP